MKENRYLRQRLGGLGLLIVVAWVAVGYRTSSPLAPPPPNILLIYVDDLGWADLGSYGSDYYETPHIDRLAREGVRFTNAYAAAAICSPSRSALMTGKYPARLGITDWIRASFQNAKVEYGGKNKAEYEKDLSRRLVCPPIPFELPLAEKTTAEYLKEQGYRTAFVGKWHLGSAGNYPEQQGFEINIGGCDFGQPPSYFDPYVNAAGVRFPETVLRPRKTGEYLTDREADEVVQLIRSFKGKPFFINYAPYTVHTPLQAKPELVAKYRQKQPSKGQQNAVYAAMIESLDDAVGTIMEELNQQGLLQNTLVVFTSDNGGLLGTASAPVTSNPPLRSGKGFPYEGGLRVPLVVYWKDQIKPRVSDQPTITMDLFNTFLELSGTKPSGKIPNDGLSLLGYLKDERPLPTRDLFWHFPHYRYDEVNPYTIVHSGSWKLIHDYETDSDELYNLRDDGAESRNLAAELPQKRQELRKKIDAFAKRTNARLPVVR
jgi:arylsulfatase A-like enzyme